MINCIEYIWNNIANIEVLLSILAMLCSFFLWLKTIITRRKLNVYLRKWLAKDTLKCLKYYIDTKGQQIDPCEYDEIRVANICKITEKLIPFFLKEVFKNNINNQYFVLLGDSGVGKTTFMIQLFKGYKKKLIKKYNIEYIPLLHANCINEIENIKNPENTILLLDGLDENPFALIDYKVFMNELLCKTELFYKIIITCRTQFFPNEKEEPYETGRISFDMKNKKNLFYKIYISPFEDKDIERFLKKKYPTFLNEKKRNKAIDVVRKTPYLMVRPMLLSYIDDLIQEENEYDYVYQIYEQLTEKWMLRESVPYEKLYEFTRVTAIYMYRHNTNYIEAKDIKNICKQYNINLREIEAKSRSLLNRNGIGDYKFAHKSIYEFILAREAINNLEFREEHDFSKLDMAEVFFNEMSSVYIKKELEKGTISGNFAKLEFSNIDFKTYIFESAIFRSASFVECDFSGCDLQLVDFNNCYFKKCSFFKTNFCDSICEEIDFDDCNLLEIMWRDSKISKCIFVNSDLRRADFGSVK